MWSAGWPPLLVLSGNPVLRTLSCGIDLVNWIPFVVSSMLFKVSATPLFDLEQAPPEPSLVWLPKLIGFILGLVA
jgi:hypothetical protein